MPKLKARIIAAIQSHDDFDKAKATYNLSDEELQSWFEKLSIFGRDGLRATRVQQYRRETA